MNFLWKVRILTLFLFIKFVYLWSRRASWSLVIFTTSWGFLGLLGLGSTQLTGLEDWSGSELDVLFRADSNQETWNVHELFTNSNVSLSDENSSVMNGVSELSLGNESLKSSLHDLGEWETQYVIELSFVFLEHSKSNHSSDKSITYNLIINIFNISERTFENSSWIFLL